MLANILAVLIAYLLGSIPFAYIISRWRKGVDIRDMGVRNVGAANVGREIGWMDGLAVGLLDLAKGSAAILIAFALQTTALWIGVTGAAVVLGHNFPVFPQVQRWQGCSNYDRHLSGADVGSHAHRPGVAYHTVRIHSSNIHRELLCLPCSASAYLAVHFHGNAGALRGRIRHLHGNQDSSMAEHCANGAGEG